MIPICAVFHVSYLCASYQQALMKDQHPPLRVCVYAVCVVVLCVLAWSSPNWLISQAPVQHVCCACGLLCVCNVFGALSVFCACEYVVCVCVCAVCLSVEQLQLADTNQIRLCQPCDVCVCCTSY